jgi:GTP cyclohydrolase II
MEVERVPEAKIINGDPELVRVDRVLAELRSGRWVAVQDESEAMLVAAVDGAPGELLREMSFVTAPELSLVIAAQRAAMLGLPGATDRGLAMTLPAGMDAAKIEWIAFEPTLSRTDLAELASVPASPLAETGLTLAKQAGLAPVVLACKAADDDRETVEALLAAGTVLSVSRRQVEAFPTRSAHGVKRVGEAAVPLFGSEDARFVVFRQPGAAADHVAVIVGRPPPGAPVLVRLHSACLTGDLFASLRCDCGEQLHAAVGAIAAAGGGVILYLAQEGRGIGLVNKMRAYALQDQGFDTIEADHLLGFAADERRYEVAAEILKALGIGAIRLMTNNPDKLAALEDSGIAIAERLPLIAPVNPHNERYLAAKATKAGHMLHSVEAAGD